MSPIACALSTFLIPSAASTCRVNSAILLPTLLGSLVYVGPIGGAESDKAQTPPAYPAFPSETPTKFEPATESFDYIKREVMIPMRDEVKLHTLILIPKTAKDAPILLTRTPYDASKLTSHSESGHLGPILEGYDNATDVIVEGGYIRVV